MLRSGSGGSLEPGIRCLVYIDYGRAGTGKDGAVVSEASVRNRYW